MAAPIKENAKARKYAGQLISIKRKSMILSVVDRISHVDESAEATYLELLHPASVYRVSILGDIQNGIATEANIRPEDVKQLSLRLSFAEQKLFEREALGNAAAGAAPAEGQDAFMVKFMMGKLKGETPGGYLIKAADKDAAMKELKSQYDFLAQNAAKFAANQKVMNAIRSAIGLYRQGKLEGGTEAQAQAQGGGLTEATIYAPPEKTFRKDTKQLPDGRVLTKCYKIRISFVPSNEYPYVFEIKNRYAAIDKDPNTGLEKIRSAEQDASDVKQFRMSLTSGEMIALVNAMDENLRLYKSCVYGGMRKKDWEYQEANRRAWKPQSQQ